MNSLPKHEKKFHPFVRSLFGFLILVKALQSSKSLFSPALFLLFALFYLLGLVLPFFSNEDSAFENPDLARVEKVRLVDCYDGDTCQFKDSNGLQLKVRLLGIDAPERGRKTSPGQPFALESRTAALGWLKKNFDSLWLYQRKADGYGRYLAYVLNTPQRDSLKTSLNYALVEKGFAFAYRGGDFLPDERELFEAAEYKARKAQRGLWADGLAVEEPGRFRKRLEAASRAKHFQTR